MSSNKKFAITAFIGTILLLAMFGVKALLYAPIFLVVGLIMLFLAPGGKSSGADKS
jgi:predicted permease